MTKEKRLYKFAELDKVVREKIIKECVEDELKNPYQYIYVEATINGENRSATVFIDDVFISCVVCEGRVSGDTIQDYVETVLEIENKKEQEIYVSTIVDAVSIYTDYKSMENYITDILYNDCKTLFDNEGNIIE